MLYRGVTCLLVQVFKAGMTMMEYHEHILGLEKGC